MKINKIIDKLTCHGDKADLRDYKIHAQKLAAFIAENYPEGEFEEYIRNEGKPYQHILYSCAFVNETVESFDTYWMGIFGDRRLPEDRKIYVSIGLGDRNDNLYKKYDIPCSNIYAFNFEGKFVSDWRGSITNSLYYVPLEVFGSNLERFVKIVVMGGEAYVSIGQGSMELSLVTKYGIGPEMVFRDSALYGFCGNWMGDHPSYTYYVPREYYLKNIEKFQTILHH